ncbi:MAG: hypothetical protein A2831_02550 [Candidatus Yanofskybacteria bacterium RIFCSPHIGHO2_01_FULL_44_17]|uniref:Uncharacterized protein n=1 Tax=Candidatus Yanofskybacteria bacterium RIFCSPHIGHO2_01_FULL_44_17 TaxID=1802668 RepID=A0A1F8EVN2_9BACT|nr:MAG: hypothetical protein A2831_02550 [Candidatus Yanofskybacteria bacterium RIFCSPHIGHO2_01_FULL_44_17]
MYLDLLRSSRFAPSSLSANRRMGIFITLCRSSTSSGQGKAKIPVESQAVGFQRYRPTIKI